MRAHPARISIAITSCACLIGLGTWAFAQTWTPLPEPVVFSGPDIGFRVEGRTGDMPTGKIVIRVNGKWVEVQIGGPPGNVFVVPPPPPPPQPPGVGCD
jgi:hypothetical protein